MRGRSVVMVGMIAVAAAIAGGAQHSASRSQVPGSQYAATFASEARFVLTPDNIERFLRSPAPSAWEPGVNTETQRGGLEIYQRVAPAVVVIRSEIGHGTGFLIGSDGLILTNHHVVSGGLRHDGPGSTSYASVYLGTMTEEGIVALREDPIRGLVHKMDAVRDLALLKLERVPEDVQPLRFLRLADEPPRPGQPAAIIGHPSSGMLWTYRAGQVASVGWAPADLVNVLMPRLAARGMDRAAAQAAIERVPSRRIILSSCEANPGDSGGPVVDDEGQVIAVTFAIPSDPGEAKFSYHVHLDEVRSFLEEAPGEPMLVVPNTWDLGLQTLLEDLDDDGRPDLLVSGDGQPRTFLLDLDNDTDPVYFAEENLDELVTEKGWDFEVGWYLRPGALVVAYDRDGRDGIDLILEGDYAENVTHHSFRREEKGGWTYQADPGVELWSADHLVDPSARGRFLELEALMN